MKTINKRKAQDWFCKKGIEIKGDNIVGFPFKKNDIFSLPVDSGKKTALSNVIATFFKGKKETCLWINEYGVWPSCEDMNLFGGFRKSLNEKRSLHEKPGHLISCKDFNSFRSLLAMILYFCWGVVVASDKFDVAVVISHDEKLKIYSSDEKQLGSMRTNITRVIK